MCKMYEKIKDLCDEHKINVSQLCKEVGISKSSLTELKAGRTKALSARNTAKIANFFGVSSDELLGNEKKLTEDDKEMKEYLEFLKYRPEGKMLFSVAKGCTKEEIEQAVKIIDALRKNDD